MPDIGAYQDFHLVRCLTYNERVPINNVAAQSQSFGTRHTLPSALLL